MRELKITILVLATQLTGCFWQTANNIDLRKATSYCEGIVNIESISISFLGEEKVKCVDGTFKYLDNVKVPKEKNNG